MTAWTPRPPVDDEPACWSWDVPPLVSRDELKARQAALNATLPPDERRDVRAFDYISPDTDRFWRFHAGRCAICGGGGTATVPDHCHSTGQVRGLCCPWCNAGEGKSSHVAFEWYRLLHPAAILDYHKPYHDGITWHHGWNVWEHKGRTFSMGWRPAEPWPRWRPDMPVVDLEPDPEPDPPGYDPWKDNALAVANFDAAYWEKANRATRTTPRPNHHR